MAAETAHMVPSSSSSNAAGSPGSMQTYCANAPTAAAESRVNRELSLSGSTGRGPDIHGQPRGTAYGLADGRQTE